MWPSISSPIEILLLHSEKPFASLIRLRPENYHLNNNTFSRQVWADNVPNCSPSVSALSSKCFPTRADWGVHDNTRNTKPRVNNIVMSASSQMSPEEFIQAASRQIWLLKEGKYVKLGNTIHSQLTLNTFPSLALTQQHTFYCACCRNEGWNLQLSLNFNKNVYFLFKKKDIF